MKKRSIIQITLAGLMTVGIAIPAQAENPDEMRNLFETAGAKQTSKDFKPAGDSIKTNFGKLKFEGGAFPTEESVQKIYDEMDMKRLLVTKTTGLRLIRIKASSLCSVFTDRLKVISIRAGC